MVKIIAANDLQVGMGIGFLNIFKIKAIGRTSSGDVYYRTFRRANRVNGRRLIKVSI